MFEDMDENFDFTALINEVTDEEKSTKELDNLRKRIAENGSAMVEEEGGQWTMVLGTELSFDEAFPVSETELKWREKHKL